LDGALKDKLVRTRFLKKAAKSLDGLDLLVQDLLTLSQIEIGNVKMHYEYFDFRKIVSEVFEQLEESAEKRGVKLKEECTEDQVLLYADYHKIYQVITNLVINGIKYNKDKGEVTVATKDSRGYYLISISDSGEGIEKEHLDRIFERFYRVDKSRARIKGGTGLGLAIVKHIIEGHSASVTVESTVGVGSVFKFRLPKSSYKNI
jgi:two-component system phosphate regulon sensor histidine kinase PhoR